MPTKHKTKESLPDLSAFSRLAAFSGSPDKTG